MSLLAGILSGIVGMASLTLYPVLLSLGIPPITANATITVANSIGGFGSVVSSIKELNGHWKQAIQIALISTAGGVCGALILIHSSNASFQKFVPIFILMAGIMILVPNKKTKTNEPKPKSKFVSTISWVGVLGVGMYSGYFGAGAGLLMIGVLSKVVHERYAVYNAFRNFAAAINNATAAVMFIFMLSIDWAVVLPLMFGLFVGNYIGPIIVRFIPSKVIKLVVGCFALILSAYLAYQAYF
ncbi:sulfite exporter TauE/SafE family protein [Paucilactobacillus nenjiangensis]|jgi:uncharacterized membrane protein YfcA